jgi:iron complex transport system ATP-binding protein
MRTELIACRDVHFRYPGAPRPTLRGVGLALHGGELLVLAGPNGCGKSTLLSLLCGCREVAHGTVTLDGAPIAGRDPRAIARRIAALPQSELAVPYLTGFEMAMLGRTPHLGGVLRQPTAHDRAVAEEALRRAGAGAFRDRRLGELSGGERQLVLIARALAQEPAALLLDEPSSSLDLAHQQALFRLLRTLAERDGLGILAVTHDLNLAARYADRLAVLSEGAIVADGAPGEVLTEEMLRRVYGAEAWAMQGPDGRTTVGLLR